jgi:hypothetical protein
LKAAEKIEHPVPGFYRDHVHGSVQYTSKESGFVNIKLMNFQNVPWQQHA